MLPTFCIAFPIRVSFPAPDGPATTKTRPFFSKMTPETHAWHRGCPMFTPPTTFLHLRHRNYKEADVKAQLLSIAASGGRDRFSSPAQGTILKLVRIDLKVHEGDKRVVTRVKPSAINDAGYGGYRCPRFFSYPCLLYDRPAGGYDVLHQKDQRAALDREATAKLHPALYPLGEYHLAVESEGRRETNHDTPDSR